MRRRRLKRRLFWTGVIVAFMLLYVVLSVARFSLWTRDLVTGKARLAGLPR